MVVEFERHILRLAPPGTRIEFGVFMGRTLRQIAQAGERTIGVDSFEGMAEPGEHDKRGDHSPYPKGRLQADEEAVRSVVPSNVTLVRGFIPDVLPKLEIYKPFAFAHVDLDHYEPTLATIKWLLTRMVPGGVICCDDWFEGRDWLASRAISEVAATLPLTGTSYRKAWWVLP